MKTYEEYRALVEEALPEELKAGGSIPEVLMEAMHYSLMAGGKRIRPVLLLAACEMAGGKAEEALPFACALEMIHTYSLIHDDLPAMDNDDLRRGKPTNHRMFGEAMAILAGDGLLNTAAERMTLAAARRKDFLGIRAAHAILRRAGASGMIAGQTADLKAEGQTPSLETLRYIHTHKTADLLTAPIEAGMILAGAEEKQLAYGIEYGTSLGLAFQMTDDLLDVVGDSSQMGKNTGMDAALEKMTWVSLRGVEGTREDAGKAVERACSALRGMEGYDTRFFEELAQSVLSRIS